MRTIYHNKLADLARQLAEMCGLAGAAMKGATQALLQADAAAAERVIGDHEALVAMREHLEKEAFGLVALQQPVAGELRAVFAAVDIVGDAERMGALAVHVAKIARREYPRCVVPEELRAIFADMAAVANTLSDNAKQALITRDPEQAAKLHEHDDAMDALYRELLGVLMGREWKENVAVGVELALLGRFYERFADHAVEIGRRVIFAGTGALPPADEISAY